MMTINEDRLLGRAKNAILTFLERRLSVPRIYIDALWAGRRVEILAIDRDGVGDVHAVLLFVRSHTQTGKLEDDWDIAQHLLDRFTNIPAQYKYIGLIDPHHSSHPPTLFLPPSLKEKSFSTDGLGRVGFITINVFTEEDPQIKLEIKPERFRAKIAKLADEYVQQHEPDWQIRA